MAHHHHHYYPCFWEDLGMSELRHRLWCLSEATSSWDNYLLVSVAEKDQRQNVPSLTSTYSIHVKVKCSGKMCVRKNPCVGFKDFVPKHQSSHSIFTTFVVLSQRLCSMRTGTFVAETTRSSSNLHELSLLPLHFHLLWRSHQSPSKCESCSDPWVEGPVFWHISWTWLLGCWHPTGPGVHVLAAPFLIHLPANALEKAAEDGPIQETWMQVLAFTYILYIIYYIVYSIQYTLNKLSF